MRILVTGGAGYIGSHTCVELLQANYDVVVLDNFSNSSREALRRVEKICGKSVLLVEGDIRNKALLNTIFSDYAIDAVIHFAGLKAVGESVDKPLEYYDNNVTGSLCLFSAMADAGVKNIVFSSSATVYGEPESMPVNEQEPLLPATNPYGRSKTMIEDVLRDLSVSDSKWNILLLRYFNPAGAHVSGLIGEDPSDIPNNLLPYVTQVALGKLSQLQVFGGDYPTCDGTGVRDYIHVVDLAKGHLKALEKLQSNPRIKAYNLGTGKGYSVLQVVKAFENATEKKIPFAIVERRAGDIATCYADASLAKKELNWQAEHDINDMMIDAWRWQKNNPEGYRQP